MTSKRFGQFSHLINFVYLAKNSYSPNTAKSYIAAIGERASATQLLADEI
jgi:hypothetical protein